MTQPERYIFIVDDSKPHRRLIRRALKKGGLAQPVLEADSLTAARALLLPVSTVEPLLLIVDLNLGDGRGTTLVRELRTSSQFQLVPILVLSTSALESDIDDSLRSGANAFLTKSTDLEELTSNICGEVTRLLSTRA